tara:strand:+ start:448 stop:657 length:210 start_codon:yes stop_codon:yes gene_type:complete
MFQYLVIKAKRRHQEPSEDYDWWLDRFATVREILNEDIIDKENQAQGLKASYEQFQLGIQMTDDFWQIY